MKRFSQVELLQITKLTFKPLKNGWYRCWQTFERIRNPKRYAAVVFRMIQGIRLSLRRQQEEKAADSIRAFHPSTHNRDNMLKNISEAAAAGKYYELADERPEFRRVYLGGVNADEAYCPHCYRDVKGVLPGLIKCAGPYCGREFIAVVRADRGIY